MALQSIDHPPDDGAALLAVTHASKSYHGVPALIDAALELRSGEVHALIGENGAGKSTLIKLLAGVLSPDSIEIRVRGRLMQFHHAQDAFDAGLRFIHQELNTIPTLSVAENIFLSQPYPTRAGLFVRWRTLNQRAADVLARLGVHHISPRQIMARLSPGDQMLVKIASAFVGDSITSAGDSTAWVYVMDEPTAALTGQEAAMLFDVIQRLRRRGCAILYVSHRLDEIFEIADRVTVMRDGRVVTTAAIEDTTPADLIRLMTGRDLQQVYPARDPGTTAGERLLLDVQGLTTHAIRDVSFHLREGEILGIAGLSGSGRTELLRALMGADRVLGGTLRLSRAGRLQKLSPAEAWRHGIAYVPEERRSQGLILSRSVSDNITLPHLRDLARGPFFLNHQRERETSQMLGKAVRLQARSVEQITRQLSGGNQQKTVFARALVRSPQILLLDEPTRGVDVGAKYDIYTLIRQISARGTGIIMVSSELPELLGMCDRILVMREGRVIGAVKAGDVTEEQLLALCYGEIPHANQLTTD